MGRAALHQEDLEAPASPESAAANVVAVDRDAKKREHCVGRRFDLAAAEEPEVAVVEKEDSGREKLKRHRKEVAGSVRIPDTWGQEGFLSEWKDCAAFDRASIPAGLTPARKALVDEWQECRRAAAAAATGVHVANYC